VSMDTPGDLYGNAEREWLRERGWRYCKPPFVWEDPETKQRFTQDEAVSIERGRDRDAERKDGEQ
jgi:hypothetical protein